MIALDVHILAPDQDPVLVNALTADQNHVHQDQKAEVQIRNLQGLNLHELQWLAFVIHTDW